MNLRILKTSDGSHTIFDSDFNETYHSVHGAIQESNHVFIQQGLDYSLKKKNKINILEVGFGGASQYKKMESFFNENSISYTGIDYTPHFVEKAKLKLSAVESIHPNIAGIQLPSSTVAVES